MSEENKTVELSDEELENVTGGVGLYRYTESTYENLNINPESPQQSFYHPLITGSRTWENCCLYNNYIGIMPGCTWCSHQDTIGMTIYCKTRSAELDPQNNY